MGLSVPNSWDEMDTPFDSVFFYDAQRDSVELPEGSATSTVVSHHTILVDLPKVP